MAPAQVTRRLAHSLSYVVLSSSPSGRMTIPLVDPTTGELEHYALVRMDSSPTLSTQETKDQETKRAHCRTLSENGLLFRGNHTRASKQMKNENEQRLIRLAEEYLLDVSPDALRVLERDSAWPCIGGSDSVSSLPLSPKTKMAQAPSFTRFETRSNSFEDAVDSTPSLMEDSQRSISMYASSPSFAHTPARRLVQSARIGMMRDSKMGESEASSSSILDSIGSTSRSDTNNSVPVGLGIMGMTNEDGSPFNGLGTLPRTHRYNATSTPLFYNYSDVQWAWAGEIRNFDIDTSVDRDGEKLDPEALFWRDATAADFRKRLDEEVSKRQLSCRRSQMESAVRANGSFKMAHYRERAQDRSLSQGQSQLRATRASRRSMPCAPAMDDVFLTVGITSYGGGSGASTPMPVDGWKSSVAHP